MEVKELKELYATKEGQARLAAMIDSMGKDALRQMCMELVGTVIDLAAELEDTKVELVEDTD